MSDTNITQIAESLERISRILAGLLLKDLETARQHERIARLKNCGFSNTEIAKMLNTSVNSVNVAVHALKSKKSRKKPGRARKN
jgi:DNA-binding NarL/FixJ family response regulator